MSSRRLGGVLGPDRGDERGVGGDLTRHKQLRVRVPVDEELDTLAGLCGLEPGGEGGRLGRVAGRGALEVLGAGAGRGAAGDGPLVGPVAVDVVADASAAAGGLAVLTPEAVVGLRVHES